MIPKYFFSCYLLFAIYACHPSPGIVMNNPQDEHGYHGTTGKWINVPYRLRFETFSTSDGLCSNFVKCIFQDQKGFIWIGTDDGLNRFDGYHFISVKHNKLLGNKSLADNVIGCLTEDNNGSIWALSATGISEISENVNIVHAYSDTTFSQYFNSFHPNCCYDGEWLIWIAGSKPIAFDIRTKQFFHPNLDKLTGKLPENSVPRYVYDRTPDGRILTFIGWVERGHRSDQDVIHAQVYELKDLSVDSARLLWQESAPSLEYVTQLNKIRVDHLNRLWIGRQDGYLSRLDFNTRQVVNYKSRSGHPTDKSRIIGGTTIDMYYSMRNEVMWTAGYSGIKRILIHSDTIPIVMRYQKEKGYPFTLPADPTTAIMEDRSGNVWVGTADAGLSLYAPSKHKFEYFHQFGPDSLSLTDNNVLSLCYDEKNRLWVGTEEGLSCLIDRARGQFISYKNPINLAKKGNPNIIRGIIPDQTGKKLCLAYWGGFPNLFNLETESFELLPVKNLSKKELVEKLGNLYIRQITKDSNDNFYFANYGGYIDIYNSKKQSFIHYCDLDDEKGEKGWRSSLSISVFPEGESHIWIGNQDAIFLQCLDLTKGNSIGNFDPVQHPEFPCCVKGKGEFKHFKANPLDSSALQSAMVNCFFKDKKGRLWIGTTGGLHLLQDRNNGKFRCYGRSAGFINLVINCIQEDSKGRLWIGTNSGIHCFDTESEMVIGQYGSKDGLQGEQFAANCCTKNSYGLMAFGGANGFNLFHPDSLYFNSTPPNVTVLQVYANKVAKSIQNATIELPYDSSTVSVKLTALDFSDPTRNLFSYRIEGYEPDFSEPTIDNIANYINLPPGTHKFQVKAANCDGVFSNPSTQLTIIIRPPFYRTWWFLTFLLGVSIFTILRYLKWTLEVQRRKNLIDYLKVQSLQAQLNPHFLFNVLATMQSRILNNDPHKASKMVVDLSKLMRNFLEATIAMDADKKDIGDRPIRNGIATQEITLEQEIELLEMYIQFEQMKYEHCFKYNIKFDRDEIVPGNETLPPLLLQPYVENAIKHGLLKRGDQKGELLVHFYKDDNYLICRIEDNGVGVKRSQESQKDAILLHKSRGKELVERRVRVLNQGKYDIQISSPSPKNGGGTVVTLKIGYKEL